MVMKQNLLWVFFICVSSSILYSPPTKEQLDEFMTRAGFTQSDKNAVFRRSALKVLSAQKFNALLDKVRDLAATPAIDREMVTSVVENITPKDQSIKEWSVGQLESLNATRQKLGLQKRVPLPALVLPEQTTPVCLDKDNVDSPLSSECGSQNDAVGGLKGVVQMARPQDKGDSPVLRQPVLKLEGDGPVATPQPQVAAVPTAGAEATVQLDSNLMPSPQIAGDGENIEGVSPATSPRVSGAAVPGVGSSLAWYQKPIVKYGAYGSLTILGLGLCLRLISVFRNRFSGSTEDVPNEEANVTVSLPELYDANDIVYYEPLQEVDSEHLGLDENNILQPDAAAQIIEEESMLHAALNTLEGLPDLSLQQDNLEVFEPSVQQDSQEEVADIVPVPVVQVDQPEQSVQPVEALGFSQESPASDDVNCSGDACKTTKTVVSKRRRHSDNR